MHSETYEEAGKRRDLVNTKVFLSFQIPEGEEPFIELTLRYLDGTAKREDLKELNEQLKNSGLKRRIFIEICRDQQMIREVPTNALNDKVTSLWVDEEQQEAGFDGDTDVIDLSAKRQPRSDYRYVAALVACLITISAALWVALGMRDVPSLARSVSAVATISESRNAEWHEEHIGLNEGDRLSSGVLKLKSGLVRLNTPGGVTMSMEGPAELNLVSESLVGLQRGRVVVHVPESQTGFRVETDLMNVVDLGTAFGVTVNPAGTTEVSVFDGVVEAFDNRRGGAGKILNRGNSMRIAPSSSKGLSTIAFRSEPYTLTWRMNTGIAKTQGKVQYLRPGLPIDPYIYEDDEYIILFPEKTGVVLENPLNVNYSTSGIHSDFSDLSKTTTIAPQTKVKSFLIQFNPIGEKDRNDAVRGGITFDRPILGVIVRTYDLIQTDSIFGIEGNTSRSINRRLGISGSRGLETGAPEDPIDTQDQIVITPDQRKLSIRLNAGATLDHIRVIVDDSE